MDRRPSPSIVFAKPLIEAYQILGYTRVAITAEEKSWLEKYGDTSPLPDFFMAETTEPVGEVLEKDGKRIGLLFFPALSSKEAPTGEMINAVIAKSQELKPEVDILIGVSAWGIRHEQELLNKSDLALDILLGAGPGRSSRGSLAQNGRIFWTRSMIKGKYVHVVKVFAWPKDQERWTMGDNIRDDLVALDLSYKDKPEIKSLFADK